jgi:hypothetical protein
MYTLKKGFVDVSKPPKELKVSKKGFVGKLRNL